MTDNIDSIFFADELIHQEFKDVYTGLYSSKEKYVDIVKAIGSKFYGMTQSELSKATGIKTGGTLTKLLDNLRESGITREYPRYGCVECLVCFADALCSEVQTYLQPMCRMWLSHG